MWQNAAVLGFVIHLACEVSFDTLQELVCITVAASRSLVPLNFTIQLNQAS